MQGAIPILSEWKEICKSHVTELGENKFACECENCELKDVCFNIRKPFGFTQEQIRDLVKKVISSS